MRTLPILLLLVVSVFLAPEARASSGKALTYRGTVHVERRGDAISAISIRGSAHSYFIVLDEQARVIAGYHGRRVEVTGEVIRVAGEERLRVASVRLLE